MPRKIPLRVMALEHLGREIGPVHYGEMIINLVTMPPGGLSLAEMVVPLAIKRAVYAALEAEAVWVELFDQQWGLLVRRLQTYRFPVAAEAYQEFARAVLQAQEVEEPAVIGPRAVT